MTRNFFIFSFLFFTQISFAQGIEFFHGTWQEALENAKTEQKLIFVDAFAQWCGPCKRMAANTFPAPEVGEFFNKNFINLKIDMEAAENASFARTYPVSSYPTLYFIDHEGKVVMREIGAKDVNALLGLGARAMKANDRSGDYEKEYEEGNRDAEFVLAYVKALNQAGKPSLQVTNDFLNSQKDLTTEENLRFILEGCVECDSRVFDLLTKYRPEIEAIQGKEAVAERIEAACNATLSKAIEFKYEPLLEEAKRKMKEFLPEKAETFAYAADRKYYAKIKDVDKYLASAKDCFKKSIKNDPAACDALAKEVMQTFKKEKAALEFAEDVADRAADKGGLPTYYMTLATAQRDLGKTDKAIKSAQKARKLADQDPRLAAQIDSFISHLKESGK